MDSVWICNNQTAYSQSPNINLTLKLDFVPNWATFCCFGRDLTLQSSIDSHLPVLSASLSPKALTLGGLSLASEHVFPRENHVRAGVERLAQMLYEFPRREENTVATDEPSWLDTHLCSSQRLWWFVHEAV